MKRNAKLPRQATNLSEAFCQRLDTYALAAGAAGVSLLALASPSDAAVRFTQENIIIKRPSTVWLDFDSAVAPQFSVRNITASEIVSASTLIRATFLDLVFVNGPGSATGVEVVPGQDHSAAALTVGSKIGSSRYFQGCTFPSFCEPDGGIIMAFFSTGGSKGGNWMNASKKYLGLKFTLSDGTHYGWARFSVQTAPAGSGGKTRISATFTGYAYEDVPNMPIVAGDTGLPAKPSGRPRALLHAPLGHGPASPQPAYLGMLALGAPGISFWRKEEAATAR